MTDVSLASIRRDRDRFVGFAFAAADLLFEVSPEGEITSALGALGAISRQSPSDLAGWKFIDLFAPETQPRLSTALAVARSRGRMKAVRVQILGPDGPAPVRVGAVFGGGVFKVTVTLLPASYDQPIDQRTGFLTSGNFAEQAAKALSAAGAQSTLTLIELAGLDAAIARAPDERDDILAAIGAVMMDNAEGGLAAQIGPDRFGMVRKAGAPDTLDRLEKVSPDGVSVARTDMPQPDPSLSADDMRSALFYVMRRFAEDGLSNAPGTLNIGFKSMLTETLGRIDSLRSTLPNGVKVAYQPICGLADGTIKHHEVLARLDGSSSPQNEITFAEEIGVVGELDLKVARIAIDALELGAPTPLAVNVSARSLESDMFVETFLALTGRYGRVRNRLMVELTETADIEDLDRAARVLWAFRDAGHAVCIDDFGGGAASLPYLRVLPAKYLKIDGLYVDKIAGNPTDQAIVRAIAQLAKEMKLTTVAERVETEDQARVLRDLGVDCGQGWLYGRPSAAPLAAVATQAAPKTPVLAAKRKGFTAQWG